VRKNRLQLAACAILVGLVILAPGCSSKEEKVASFLASGDKLLAAGDPVRAVLEYKNALQIDVKNARATLGLGKAYLAEKEFQRAFGAFRSALGLDPNCDEARVEVAWLLVMGGRGQDALDELEKLKAPDAFKARSELIKARALASLKKFKESVEVLSKLEGAENNKEAQMLLAFDFKSLGSTDAMKQAALKWRTLDPEDPSSYLFLAQYDAEKGDRPSALSELKKMREAKPEEPGRALLFARSLEALGFINEAETAFESLPESNDGLAAKADFWLRRKNLSKSRSILEKLVTTSPKNIDAFIRLSQIYSEQSEFPKAYELLDRSQKDDLKKQDREKILLARAVLKAKQRDFASAQSVCEEVLKENQANMDGHLLLGKILLSQKKPRDAELHLHQAAVARPGDEEAQILFARCLLQNNNDALAGDTLRRAVETNPKSLKLRLELLRYHLAKNEQDQALRVLDKGIELDPDDLNLLRVRGELKASRKDWSGAEKDFRKIMEVRPKMPLGYMEMGRLEMTQGKPDEAITWFQKVNDLETGWQVAIPALFEIYRSKGDKASAIDIVEKEAEKRSNAPLAHFFLAQAYDSTGDLDQAQKALAIASQLAPEWPNPYQLLAAIYAKQGKLPDEITKLETTYKSNPTNPLRIELAVFYERAERFEDAIRIYADLLDKIGEKPEFMNNLAYLLAETLTDKEKLAKAAELAGQALTKEPNSPNFLDTAAWVAYKQGDLESAWDFIQDAMMHGESPLHDLHAAIISNERGDREQAVEYLNKALKGKLDKKSSDKATELKKEWIRT
jgi:tetratricopeptide (TPR) repeat protein